MTQIKNEILTKDNDINILALLHFLWNERKKIILIVLISLIIGVLYAFIATPWYQTSIKILPNEDSGNDFGRFSSIAAIAGINIGKFSENKQAIYPEIIKSNFVLDRVLKNKFKNSSFDYPVSLFKFWDIEIDSNSTESIRKTYEKSKRILRETYIQSDLDKETNILKLSVSAPRDPLLATSIANFIIEQLDYYNRYMRKNKASEQRIFIENGLEDAEKALFNAQIKVKNFKERNRGTQYSPQNQLELDRLETEVDVQKSIYIELKKQLELIKIEEIKETDTFDILEEATPPSFRIKPHRKIIVIIAFILGLIISILYVIIDEFIIKKVIERINT